MKWLKRWLEKRRTKPEPLYRSPQDDSADYWEGDKYEGTSLLDLWFKEEKKRDPLFDDRDDRRYI